MYLRVRQTGKWWENNLPGFLSLMFGKMALRLKKKKVSNSCKVSSDGYGRVTFPESRVKTNKHYLIKLYSSKIHINLFVLGHMWNVTKVTWKGSAQNLSVFDFKDNASLISRCGIDVYTGSCNLFQLITFTSIW